MAVIVNALVGKEGRSSKMSGYATRQVEQRSRESEHQRGSISDSEDRGRHDHPGAHRRL